MQRETFIKSWWRGDRAPFTAKRIVGVCVLMLVVPAATIAAFDWAGLAPRYQAVAFGLAALIIGAYAYLPARGDDA